MQRNKKIRSGIIRIGIYGCGMLSVSVGIVLCTECGWGISPISSWPFILTDIIPLSFGTLTMLFHLVNIIFQYTAEKKLLNVRVLLQIPVAVFMGILIDLTKMVLRIDSTHIINQILALGFSVFLTALGMVLMINMKLVQNPPDGTVRQLSSMTGMEMGDMKLIYDVFMLITSNILSFVVLGNLKGLGLATVVSAIFVGKTVCWLQKGFGADIEKYGKMP